MKDIHEQEVAQIVEEEHMACELESELEKEDPIEPHEY